MFQKFNLSIALKLGKLLMKQPNLYEILHVGQNAPVEVIKAAYKGLANIYHPDKYKGDDANEKMNQIRQAYETLSDEFKRKAYDALLKKIVDSENEASASKNWPPKPDPNLPPKQAPNFKHPDKKDNKQHPIQGVHAMQTKSVILGLFCLLGVIGLFVVWYANVQRIEHEISTMNGLAAEPDVTTTPTIESPTLAENQVNTENTVPAVIESESTPIVDDEILMRSAVEKFNRTIDEGGISGAIADIKDCYPNVNEIKLYCFYMDYAARIFDASVSEQLKIQPQDYFTDKNFNARIYENVYAPHNSTIDEANYHLRLTSNKITKLLLEKTVESAVSS